MNLLEELQHRFRPVLAQLSDDPQPLLDMLRPAQDPKFGDYQANCAMPLAKRLGTSPREVAERIVAGLELDDMCHPPEIAGPGFINLRLKDSWIADTLQSISQDQRLGIAAADRPRRFVVDFSSPNVAKPLHVGHIRSTVIGDALCRTLQFLGHHVTSDNHLGDWGTQFGMIIYGYKHFADHEAFAENPVAELSRLYGVVNQLIEYHEAVQKRPILEQQVKEYEAVCSDAATRTDKAEQKKAGKQQRRLRAQLADARQELLALRQKIEAVESDAQRMARANQHPDIARAVLAETARLHAGDAENRRLWEQFLPQCRADIQRIYDRLDVSFDVELGESFYQDRLDAVVQDLLNQGLARESEGAICVFLEGFETPMIVQKQDGAYLYATTDLATIRYRMETWDPDAILYVVDHRQGEHFLKLFAAARKWGYEQVELQHISFGTVLGEDGRPFKTRSGQSVGLEGLLDQAVQKALEVVSANDDARPDGPVLDEAQRHRVAEVVGHGAIKYSDLSHNRTSDYVFSFDKMVALEGNTATYMQYSYARTQSIFGRGDVDVQRLRAAKPALRLEHPAERALAWQLVRFGEALGDMVADYRPNQLTNYLYELARRFSTFFESCPVLRAESDALRDSRLLLCDMTGRTIRQGLALLGISVVERM